VLLFLGKLFSQFYADIPISLWSKIVFWFVSQSVGLVGRTNMAKWRHGNSQLTKNLCTKKASGKGSEHEIKCNCTLHKSSTHSVSYPALIQSSYPTTTSTLQTILDPFILRPLSVIYIYKNAYTYIYSIANANSKSKSKLQTDKQTRNSMTEVCIFATNS